MNKKFKEYLKRFCKAYSLSSDIAKKHAIVKEVEQYYEDEIKFKVKRD